MPTIKDLSADLIEAAEKSGYVLVGFEINMPETENMIGKEVSVYLRLLNPAVAEIKTNAK